MRRWRLCFRLRIIGGTPLIRVVSRHTLYEVGRRKTASDEHSGLAVHRAHDCIVRGSRTCFRRFDCSPLRVIGTLGHLVFDYWLEFGDWWAFFASTDQTIREEMERLRPLPPNRVGGRVAPPSSHTTGHAGPRPAVPDSPCGMTQPSFSAAMVAAHSSASRLQRFRIKTTDGRDCLPSSALPELCRRGQTVEKDSFNLTGTVSDRILCQCHAS
jgi:hypothetical protein